MFIRTTYCSRKSVLFNGLIMKLRGNDIKSMKVPLRFKNNNKLSPLNLQLLLQYEGKGSHPQQQFRYRTQRQLI